jgi:hypothetical protein
MSQTKFYAVVYNDGEVAGPVLASLWLKKPKADAEAVKLEASLLKECGCKGGAGVIVIDTKKAK